MSTFIEQPRYSCAIGAQQTVVAIKRGVPILHSGPGCSSKVSSLIGQGEGYAGGNTIPCTNTGESEVVYGGEKKLRSVIDGAFKVVDGDLFVILTGCTSDIIGDDIANVASDYQEAGKPVVWVETGGFKSNNYVSHEKVVKAIIEQYVDKNIVDSTIVPGLVNLFATIPYQDPFWNGNLQELKRILEGIGLKVNILFGHESGGVEEWKTIPKAQFNILVSAWYGKGIVELLSEKYGTPFIQFPYLPVGGLETSKFLRQVAQFAELESPLVEAFIKKEEEKFYAHIERTADFMLEFRYGLPRRFYTLLDASYALGVSKFLLNELGIIPEKQFIVDNTPEEFQPQIREQFEKISDLRAAQVEFNIDGGDIHQKIRQDLQKNRSLILGSGWERDLANDIKADLLILSVPTTYRLVLNCGYAGYEGGLRLVEDIYDHVLNTYR